MPVLDVVFFELSFEQKKQTSYTCARFQYVNHLYSKNGTGFKRLQYRAE
jgi:hypothetical protein